MAKRNEKRIRIEHALLVTAFERRAMRLKRTVWAAAILSSLVTYLVTRLVNG